VLDALRGAQSLDQLDAAADLIKHLPDEQDRADCLDEYHGLKGNAGDD
jgi:hypothetical protein